MLIARSPIRLRTGLSVERRLAEIETHHACQPGRICSGHGRSRPSRSPFRVASRLRQLPFLKVASPGARRVSTNAARRHGPDHDDRQEYATRGVAQHFDCLSAFFCLLPCRPWPSVFDRNGINRPHQLGPEHRGRQVERPGAHAHVQAAAPRSTAPAPLPRRFAGLPRTGAGARHDPSCAVCFIISRSISASHAVCRGRLRHVPDVGAAGAEPVVEIQRGIEIRLVVPEVDRFEVALQHAIDQRVLLERARRPGRCRLSAARRAGTPLPVPSPGCRGR